MCSKYAGYRLAQWLSLGIPAPLNVWLAERLADWRWRLSTTTRAAVQQNLAMVQGEPVQWDSPLIREAFQHFGRYVVEFFTMHRLGRAQLQVDGAQHVREAQRAQRGTIALTAHVGNWELGALAIHRMGVPVTAVALPHEDSRMDRLFNDQRRRCGISVIPLGEDAARRSLQSLRQRQVLGLLGDQDFADHGVAVSFCGRPVLLPRGPAILSLRSQAPVVPVFLIREGPGQFRFFCEPPIWPRRDGLRETVVEHLTQQYAAVMERYVKRFPSQWMMFQPLVRAAQSP